MWFKDMKDRITSVANYLFIVQFDLDVGFFFVDLKIQERMINRRNPVLVLDD